MLTKEELIAFEADIGNEFGNKKIRSPVHIDDGSEDEFIKIFKENNIGEKDWCFGTWRTHYIHLLKGVPKEKLKQDILAGKSISLCYPEYKTFSSAIVGGSIPIGVGTALSLKLKKEDGKVFIFVGDMSSESGTFYENLKYSIAQELPVKFIVCDNSKSVCTPTRECWNIKELFAEKTFKNGLMKDYLYYFSYTSRFPHAGFGSRIQF